MQPNITTRSLAASDFSVKRQKKKWPEGTAQTPPKKNKTKKTVTFYPICGIKITKMEEERSVRGTEKMFLLC